MGKLFKYPPPIPNPNPNPSHIPNHNIPPNPNPIPSSYLYTGPGACLMALLATGLPSHPTPSSPWAPVASLPSSKMPRGRVLGGGDRVVYDVDARPTGESMPPLMEVTPITKYISDPELVLGRQIAVNQTYLCYGLKLGGIRVLNNNNTALRSLLRGHSKRVTDMAFFDEDVHLLASASIDGRVFVWKIDEGPDDENKPQITGKIVVAIQIVGDQESYHPRICWHSHKQKVLAVAIGNRVLKIDATKVVRGKVFSAEEPLRCHIGKLIGGVQFIGKHEGEVTDLSISQWMTTHLASASKDGTVKIWDDRKAVPLVVFRPHDGLPVSSVAFLTSPHSPEHIVLITAGPLNREVKIWTSTSEEGWLLPSDSESWQCTQTLELRSSAEPRPEEAFFNQVAVLPRASLILLANGKKNAIYAVHVDYGPFPALTRMDYITDFTVSMPTLSLTGTSDSLPDGEQVVNVYCVETLAIQQYALDLAQCLPPVDALLGRDSAIRMFDTPVSEGSFLEPSRGPTVSSQPLGSSSPKISVSGSNSESASATIYPVVSVSSDVSGVQELTASNADPKPSAPLANSNDDSALAVSSPGPLNMDFSSGISLLRNPSKSFEQVPALGEHDVNQTVDYSAEGRVDTGTTTASDASPRVHNFSRDEPKDGLIDNPVVPNSHLMYNLAGKTPHLVTPLEILSGAMFSSENTLANQGPKGEELKFQEAVSNNDLNRVDSQVKLVDESGLSRHEQNESYNEPLVDSAENRDKPASSIASEAHNEMDKDSCSLKSGTYNANDAWTGDSIAVSDAEQPSFSGEDEPLGNTIELPEKRRESASTVSESPASAKVKKQKAKQNQASGSTSPSSPFNSTDLSNEPGSSIGFPSNDAAFSHFQSVQESLTQRMSMQKELQKPMSAIVAVPINRGGKRVEASLGCSMEKVKASGDALWARFQEGLAKHEKAERERMQQLTSLITSCVNTDFPSMLERALKEGSSIGPSLARAITPAIEKCISSAITDCFQRGIGDKAVGQLEKSVSSKLEATVARQIQAQFLTSGKQALLQEAMRSNLDSSMIPAFERSCKAMFEQVDAVLQKGMNEHTAAAQQQFESTHTPLVLTLRALSLQQVEAPLDPTKELSKLVAEHKFEEAFTIALQRSDVSVVSWLCSQVDLQTICSMVPLPLNQGVLLALLKQLACDISNETSRKLGWITDVALVVNPTDPMISMLVRPIFEQVYNILSHQRSLPTTTAIEATSIRLILHVLNSVLRSSK